MTSATGALAERYEYDIYGNVTRFNPAGTVIPTSTIGNLHLYTGRYYDSESSNFDFRGRVYLPRLGRFLQMDPTGYVDGLNLYASYFAVNGTDPTGYKSDDLFTTTGPTLSTEIDIVSVSVYEGLGGGITVTASDTAQPCCDDRHQVIPDGDKSLSIQVKGEIGIGIGGKVTVGGIGIDLAAKGPQIQEILTLSLKSIYCGGPYGTLQTCKEEAFAPMVELEGTAGLVSVSASISTRLFMKLCAESNPSGHGSVSLSFCANSTMEAKVNWVYPTTGTKAGYSLGKHSTGDKCKEFKASF